MFHYIKGAVAHIEPGLVVIDAMGVGYAVNTSYTSASSVKVGDNATFYTYLHVREDIFDIYGFAKQQELAAFRQLISVSGVGPKAALAILGVVTAEKLAWCVESGDEKTLCTAPGVGKKLAQRMILELKGKLGADSDTGFAFADTASPSAAGGESYDRAIAALGALGYPRATAVQALKGAATESMSTDEMVRLALKNLF